MLQKTKAIVLHSIRYGESSLIVHCFTEEWGRKSFLLKGVRKSKKNNKANLYQPLFLLDLDVYYKENRDLQWIKEATLIDGVPDFSSDIIKSTQAMFLTEVLMKVLREEEKNDMLFHFLLHSLNFFESLEHASPAFHILFLFQLTRFLGFYPQNNYSEIEEFFNPETGSFTAYSFTSNIVQEKEISLQWNAIAEKNYTTIDQVFSTHLERNNFLDSLIGFYKLHSESFGELKSLEILRTVFVDE